MEKSNMLIIALLALIFIGVFHSRRYQPTTTTSKTVVVKKNPYHRNYGYKPPPPHYNPYKAQYYN
jgi:hypothetical protein